MQGVRKERARTVLFAGVCLVGLAVLFLGGWHASRVFGLEILVKGVPSSGRVEAACTQENRDVVGPQLLKSCGPRARHAALVMEELLSHPLVLSSPMRGASWTSTEEPLVVWSNFEVAFVPSDLEPWEIGSGRILGARRASPGRIEVLVTNPLRLVSLDSFGKRCEKPLHLSLEPYSAYYSGRGWFVFGLEENGKARIFNQESGAWMDFSGIPSLIQENPRDLHFRVHDGGRVFAFTQVLHPFKTVLVRRGEVEPMWIAPPDTTVSALPKGVWVALPLLPLDFGYLQTLSNLASDERVLLRFDDTGILLKSSVVPIRMAFVDTHPSTQIAITAREITASEIAIYKWHWQEQSRDNKRE